MPHHGKLLRRFLPRSRIVSRGAPSVAVVKDDGTATAPGQEAVAMTPSPKTNPRRLEFRRAGSRAVIVMLIASGLSSGLADRTLASRSDSAADSRADIPPASTTFGDRRISVPSGGHFYGSSFQTMTPDGSHVFVRSSSDLTVDPVNEILGLGAGFFDLVAGRIVRVDCSCLRIDGATSDGSAVVGSSLAKLVPDDTDASADLYLFDGAGPRLVSAGTDGNPLFVAITPDGSYVLFSIGISLSPLDTDTTRDMYRWSRATGVVDLISTGNGNPTFIAMSPDSSRILYSLDPALHLTYEWTSGSSTFLAAGTFISASPDLSRIYLNTTAALDPADQDTQTDGYRYDAGGFHVMTEPSVQFSGLMAVKSDGSAWVTYAIEQLTPDDHDAAIDFYLETASSITLLSRGDLNAQELFMDASFSSGVYTTPSRLDPADTDDFSDVYRWSQATPDAPQLLSGSGTPDVQVLAYSPYMNSSTEDCASRCPATRAM
jgi:hypothetical protein